MLTSDRSLVQIQGGFSRRCGALKPARPCCHEFHDVGNFAGCLHLPRGVHCAHALYYQEYIDNGYYVLLLLLNLSPASLIQTINNSWLDLLLCHQQLFFKLNSHVLVFQLVIIFQAVVSSQLQITINSYHLATSA